MRDDRYDNWDPAEESRRLDLAKKNLREFNWFFEQYAPPVRYFLRGLVHDKHIADDLASETFAKAIVALDSFEWRGVSFLAYLFRVAAHEATSWGRRQARIVRVDIEVEGATLRDPASDALSELELLDQIDSMLDELQGLSESDRHIIELHHLQGRPVAEIAAALRVPEGTIQARLARAREKLAMRLEARNQVGLPEEAAPRKWIEWMARQRKLGREFG